MTEHEPFALSAEMIDEAIVDLHSIHDWLRFAVSQFNAADLYFGHGTDNPWDDAGQLMAFTLHFTHLAESALLQTRLTSTEKRRFAALVQQPGGAQHPTGKQHPAKPDFIHDCLSWRNLLASSVNKPVILLTLAALCNTCLPCLVWVSRIWRR